MRAHVGKFVRGHVREFVCVYAELTEIDASEVLEQTTACNGRQQRGQPRGGHLLVKLARVLHANHQSAVSNICVCDCVCVCLCALCACACVLVCLLACVRGVCFCACSSGDC